MNDETAGGAQDWRERRRQLQDAVERHMIRYSGDFPPFFIERAEGSYIFDDSGRRILDFTSGQMCATLGHNHPDVVAAIARSCARAIHLFSWVLAPAVVELCRELGDKRGLIGVLLSMGTAAWLQSNYPQAIALYQECLALSRELGPPWRSRRAVVPHGLIVRSSGT